MCTTRIYIKFIYTRKNIIHICCFFPCYAYNLSMELIFIFIMHARRQCGSTAATARFSLCIYTGKMKKCAMVSDGCCCWYTSSSSVLRLPVQSRTRACGIKSNKNRLLNSLLLVTLPRAELLEQSGILTLCVFCVYNQIKQKKSQNLN